MYPLLHYVNLFIIQFDEVIKIADVNACTVLHDVILYAQCRDLDSSRQRMDRLNTNPV